MKALDFFLLNAGYSYDPRTETPEQGQLRCATELAQAESLASGQGLSFEWSLDDQDSSSFEDTNSPDPLWVCTCRNLDGNILSSTGGVHFGSNSPFQSPYRRVVEAELALEAL